MELFMVVFISRLSLHEVQGYACVEKVVLN